MTVTSTSLKMIDKHTNFLLNIVNCKTAAETKKLIKEASQEEVQALLDCISLRKHVPPSDPLASEFAKQTKKRKKIKSLLLKQHKLLKSIIVCVLGKIVYDCGLAICEYA